MVDDVADSSYFRPTAPRSKNTIYRSWLLGSTEYGVSPTTKCVQRLFPCVCVLQYSTMMDSLSLLVGNTGYYSCLAIL